MPKKLKNPTNLAELKERLTPKRKKFVNEYIENGGNASAAVKMVYSPGSKGGTENDVVARSMGSHLLHSPDIRAYLQLMASGASERIEELSMNARSEQVRLLANKDILDRAGYKATDRVDITTQGDKLYTDEQIKRAATEIIIDSGEGEKVTVDRQDGGPGGESEAELGYIFDSDQP